MKSSITSVQWDVCKRSGDGRTSLRAKLWMDEEMSPIWEIGEEDIAQPLRRLDGSFACLDGFFALLLRSFIWFTECASSNNFHRVEGRTERRCGTAASLSAASTLIVAGFSF